MVWGQRWGDCGTCLMTDICGSVCALGSNNNLLAHGRNVYQELQHLPCLQMSMVQVELSEQCPHIREDH